MKEGNKEKTKERKEGQKKERKNDGNKERKERKKERKEGIYKGNRGLSCISRCKMEKLPEKENEIEKEEEKKTLGIRKQSWDLAAVKVLDDGKVQVLFPLPLALHGVTQKLPQWPF